MEWRFIKNCAVSRHSGFESDPDDLTLQSEISDVFRRIYQTASELTQQGLTSLLQQTKFSEVIHDG